MNINTQQTQIIKEQNAKDEFSFKYRLHNPIEKYQPNINEQNLNNNTLLIKIQINSILPIDIDIIINSQFSSQKEEQQLIKFSYQDNPEQFLIILLHNYNLSFQLHNVWYILLQLCIYQQDKNLQVYNCVNFLYDLNLQHQKYLEQSIDSTQLKLILQLYSILLGKLETKKKSKLEKQLKYYNQIFVQQQFISCNNINIDQLDQYFIVLINNSYKQCVNLQKSYKEFHLQAYDKQDKQNINPLIIQLQKELEKQIDITRILVYLIIFSFNNLFSSLNCQQIYNLNSSNINNLQFIQMNTQLVELLVQLNNVLKENEQTQIQLVLINIIFKPEYKVQNFNQQVYTYLNLIQSLLYEYIKSFGNLDLEKGFESQIQLLKQLDSHQKITQMFGNWTGDEDNLLTTMLYSISMIFGQTIITESEKLNQKDKSVQQKQDSKICLVSNVSYFYFSKLKIFQENLKLQQQIQMKSQNLKQTMGQNTTVDDLVIDIEDEQEMQIENQQLIVFKSITYTFVNNNIKRESFPLFSYQNRLIYHFKEYLMLLGNSLSNTNELQLINKVMSEYKEIYNGYTNQFDDNNRVFIEIQQRQCIEFNTIVMLINKILSNLLQTIQQQLDVDNNGKNSEQICDIDFDQVYIMINNILNLTTQSNITELQSEIIENLLLVIMKFQQNMQLANLLNNNQYIQSLVNKNKIKYYAIQNQEIKLEQLYKIQQQQIDEQIINLIIFLIQDDFQAKQILSRINFKLQEFVFSFRQLCDMLNSQKSQYEVQSIIQNSTQLRKTHKFDFPEILVLNKLTHVYNLLGTDYKDVLDFFYQQAQQMQNLNNQASILSNMSVISDFQNIDLLIVNKIQMVQYILDPIQIDQKICQFQQVQETNKFDVNLINQLVNMQIQNINGLFKLYQQSPNSNNSQQQNPSEQKSLTSSSNQQEEKVILSKTQQFLIQQNIYSIILNIVNLLHKISLHENIYISNYCQLKLFYQFVINKKYDSLFDNTQQITSQFNKQLKSYYLFDQIEILDKNQQSILSETKQKIRINEELMNINMQTINNNKPCNQLLNLFVNNFQNKIFIESINDFFRKHREYQYTELTLSPNQVLKSLSPSHNTQNVVYTKFTPKTPRDLLILSGQKQIIKLGNKQSQSEIQLQNFNKLCLFFFMCNQQNSKVSFINNMSNVQLNKQDTLQKLIFLSNYLEISDIIIINLFVMSQFYAWPQQLDNMDLSVHITKLIIQYIKTQMASKYDFLRTQQQYNYTDSAQDLYQNQLFFILAQLINIQYFDLLKEQSQNQQYSSLKQNLKVINNYHFKLIDNAFVIYVIELITNLYHQNIQKYTKSKIYSSTSNKSQNKCNLLQILDINCIEYSSDDNIFLVFLNNLQKIHHNQNQFQNDVQKVVNLSDDSKFNQYVSSLLQIFKPKQSQQIETFCYFSQCISQNNTQFLKRQYKLIVKEQGIQQIHKYFKNFNRDLHLYINNAIQLKEIYQIYVQESGKPLFVFDVSNIEFSINQQCQRKQINRLQQFLVKYFIFVVSYQIEQFVDCSTQGKNNISPKYFQIIEYGFEFSHLFKIIPTIFEYLELKLQVLYYNCILFKLFHLKNYTDQQQKMYDNKNAFLQLIQIQDFYNSVQQIMQQTSNTQKLLQINTSTDVQINNELMMFQIQQLAQQLNYKHFISSELQNIHLNNIINIQKQKNQIVINYHAQCQINTKLISSIQEIQDQQYISNYSVNTDVTNQTKCEIAQLIKLSPQNNFVISPNSTILKVNNNVTVYPWLSVFITRLNNLLFNNIVINQEICIDIQECYIFIDQNNQQFAVQMQNQNQLVQIDQQFLIYYQKLNSYQQLRVKNSFYLLKLIQDKFETFRMFTQRVTKVKQIYQKELINQVYYNVKDQKITAQFLQLGMFYSQDILNQYEVINQHIFNEIEYISFKERNAEFIIMLNQLFVEQIMFLHDLSQAYNILEYFRE